MLCTVSCHFALISLLGPIEIGPTGDSTLSKGILNNVHCCGILGYSYTVSRFIWCLQILYRKIIASVSPNMTTLLTIVTKKFHTFCTQIYLPWLIPQGRCHYTTWVVKPILVRSWLRVRPSAWAPCRPCMCPLPYYSQGKSCVLSGQ